MSDVTIIDTVETAEKNILSSVNGIDSTIDALPEQIGDKLDAVQQDMTQLVEDITTSTDELTTAAENSPAGTPPPSLQSISSQSNESGIDVTFLAKKYLAYGNGNVLPVVTKGVMVRYSETGYPRTITDGILGFVEEDIADMNATGVFTEKQKTGTITGLTNGKTHYITAFPYSAYGAYDESMGTTNCTKCQWTGTKGTLTVNVTQDYDYKPLGEYTATMTPTAGGQPITKTQSGAATIVFSGLEAGEYTLSFSAPQYFTAPQSQSVTVTAGQSQTVDKVFSLSASLESLSWAQINEISQQGNAPNIWSVGDTKDVTVNGETLTFEIVGFNHDDLTSGGKAKITFGMKNLMAEKRATNSRPSTNSGSYAGSEMNTYVGTTFYNGMTADVRNVIKSVKKVTGNSTGSSSWSGTRIDNFKTWLFSESEVFGTKTYSVGNEGSKYAKFTSNSTRIKKLANGSGDSSQWALRSPVYNSDSSFCVVFSDGSATEGSSMGERGVCVGFCI